MRSTLFCARVRYEEEREKRHSLLRFFRMNKCEIQQPAAPRRRLRVADLNPHLMCVLCGGYYVDATTIIECLHSFCKSCLVRYLESNKYCPICEVQVHKTRPLQNIRPDHTLQDMVYKLVPGLFQKEMRCRQEFYKKHPDAPPSTPEDRGIIDPIDCQFYSPDELVSLALELQQQPAVSSSNGTNKRYLRCPAAVTIAHLQKLVRNKFGLGIDYQVDLMFSDKLLQPDLSIMEVAYVFGRKRKGQFHFMYRIVDPQCKKMRIDEPDATENSAPEPMDVDKPQPPLASDVAVPQAATESKSKLDSIISRLGTAKQSENAGKKDKMSKEWKEVQLQISENGVMSVMDISSIEKLFNSEEEIKKSVEKRENTEKKVQIAGEKRGLSEGKSKGAEEKTSSSEVKIKQADSEVKCAENKAKNAGEEKKRLGEEVKHTESKPKPAENAKGSLGEVKKPLEVTPLKQRNSLKQEVGLKPSSTPRTKSEPVSQVTKQEPVGSLCVPSNLKNPDISSDGTSKVPNRTQSSASSSVETKTTSSSARERVDAAISVAVSMPSPICSTTSSVLSVIPCTSAQSVANTAKVTINTVPVSSMSITLISSHGSVTSSSAATSLSTSTTVPSSSSSSLSLPRMPTSVSHNTPPTSTVSSKPISTAQTITTSTRIAPSVTPKPSSGNTSTKKSSSSPIGYKTLKCGPKNWNPSISRNSFLSSKMEQQQQQQQQPQQGTGSPGAPGSASSTGKPAAPPRFFKMRNTPRYLGNPASGVKPMYQVPDTKPEAPIPPKTSSVMKLDPRTLSPIVSNASSPTPKSPSSQSKGRPPFPSTTLSAQVTNHMPSSRSVTTTTTTSTASKMSELSSAQASAQAMVNFLSSPFVPKGMGNFMFGAMPGLLPAGPAQYASMLRPGIGYPPVTVSGFHSSVGMLYNHHQIHRQLNPAPPGSPTGFPPSPSSSSSSSSSLSPSSKSTTPTVQRVPASSQKPVSLPPQTSQKSNRNNVPPSSTADSVQMNGGMSMKTKQSVTPSQADRSTQQTQSPVKNSSITSLKDASKNSASKVNDNNNTLSITKTSPQGEKSEPQKLPHNISKLFPNESATCGKEKSSPETKGAGATIQPQQS